MEVQGQHLTLCEKRADEADRYVEAYLKCIYLRDRIGQTFDAIITSVVDFGCFVQIVEAAADGLLHLDNLRDDEYVKDDALQAWVGLRSKRRLQLGNACAGDRHGGESGGRTDRPGPGAGRGHGAAPARQRAQEQEAPMSARGDGVRPACGARAAGAFTGARCGGCSWMRAATIRACASCCSWRRRPASSPNASMASSWPARVGDVNHQGVVAEVEPLAPWHEDELVDAADRRAATRWCWCWMACRTRTTSAPACARPMPAVRWRWWCRRIAPPA